MDTWNTAELPEKHQFMENVQFLARSESTWNRKKQDGTKEAAVKWDYTTSADEDGNSLVISVYSSTDKESIELKKPYDLVVKKAMGADGTFYGYSLQGFGEAGKPIPRKMPQSRFQKELKMNNRAVALGAAASLYMGSSDVDNIIVAAEAFLTWLDEK